MAKLYSIGYANLKKEVFLEHLRANGITALADVRSMPYSKAFSEYNREVLADYLKSNGISYVYLGKELGPRSENRQHYDRHGQVQFSLLNQTDIFKQGVHRLEAGLAKGYQIAMMCAEKMPETCHRSLLISEHMLNDRKINTSHIHQNGAVEDHLSMRERIASALGMSGDMFSDKNDVEQEAISLCIKKYAFTLPENSPILGK